MLDPSQWDHLEGLTLSPRVLMQGDKPGPHAAVRIGSGSEFHDYRPYVSGDDVTQLDWKAFGRSDRYYLRRHQGETDLTVHMVVDASESMNFAGLSARNRNIEVEHSPTKLRYALDLAVALAFVAVRQGDLASAVVYDTSVRVQVPAGRTWQHLHLLRHRLGSVLPSPGTDSTIAPAARSSSPPRKDWQNAAIDAAGALRALGSLTRSMGRNRSRAIIVAIGDFLDEPTGFFEEADRLRHTGADIIALNVLTRSELHLDDLAGPLRLIDPETRRSVGVPGASVLNSYRQRLRRHLDELRSGCRARKIGHYLLRTDEPVPRALRRLLGAPPPRT